MYPLSRKLAEQGAAVQPRDVREGLRILGVSIVRVLSAAMVQAVQAKEKSSDKADMVKGLIG